jgi:predicted nuclease of restriction endonuclease-like (RecB) superfamily
MVRGRSREEAVFPVAPMRSDLPKDYAAALAEIKDRVRQERLRVVLAANSAMVLLYWDIGRVILDRQAREGWGARVIDRLAEDLQAAFPEMRGLSPRNLKYMRAFAGAWPDPRIVQRTVAQLPWRQNITLLERLDDPKARLWYAEKAIRHGWSQPILALQIAGRARDRQGKAVNNFKETLPPADSDLACQVFKDPYLFDFLGTADPRREREVEQALVDHVQRFLLELGSGFAFVGRQVRHPDDKPSVGLLLCRSRNKLVAEYALRGLRKPVGVAEWETKIVASLPADLKDGLPTVEEIEAELSGASLSRNDKREA